MTIFSCYGLGAALVPKDNTIIKAKKAYSVNLLVYILLSESSKTIFVIWHIYCIINVCTTNFAFCFLYKLKKYDNRV